MTFQSINDLRAKVKQQGLAAPRKANRQQLMQMLEPPEPQELPGPVRRALRVCCRECPNAGRRLKDYIREQFNAVVR